jgi:hypothetical protein
MGKPVKRQGTSVVAAAVWVFATVLVTSACGEDEHSSEATGGDNAGGSVGSGGRVPTGGASQGGVTETGGRVATRGGSGGDAAAGMRAGGAGGGSAECWRETAAGAPELGFGGNGGEGGAELFELCRDQACEVAEECDVTSVAFNACPGGCAGGLLECPCQCYLRVKKCGMLCDEVDECLSLCVAFSC